MAGLKLLLLSLVFLVAEGGFAQGKRPRKQKQRIITGEARSKGGKTKIDFDEAQIDGERRTPTGIAISKNRPEHEYDLINLRLRWHPEMIQSTANLETGRGR